MSRYLSSHLRQQAERRTDGPIPAATLGFIRQVELAERQRDREQGAVETARQTLVAAYQELGDRYGELTALQGLLAADPTNGMLRERVSCARADCILALDWLEECRLAMSQALRQAQQDAVQAADAAGRAA